MAIYIYIYIYIQIYIYIYIYILSNTKATIEVQFRKNLSNTEAELKKSVVHKKECSSERQKQLPEVFYKKIVLKNFAIFTEKHLYQNLSTIKLQPYRPATSLKRLQHRRFFFNIAQFLRTPISKSTCERLLLQTKSFVIFGLRMK